MKKTLNKILQNNNLCDEFIKKFPGGQVNHTYQIGNKYVLKLQDKLDVITHQIPLIQELVNRRALVPRIFDYGVVDGKEYMLMEQIIGNKLSEYWNTFSKSQIESYIEQICKQLKIFHSISFKQYSTQRPKEFGNWREAIENYTDFSVLMDKEFDSYSKENIKFLRDYYYQYKYLLDNATDPVLVHNDLHFENILFKGDEITAILDFDFSRQAPKEYELWHLIDFFHTPAYFVEKKLEKTWNNFSGNEELLIFKKYYPELFEDKNLIHRLRIYFIEDILGHYGAGHSSRSNYQIKSYFKSNWLQDNLNL